MIKKFSLLLSIVCLAMMAAMPAFAMDSATLLANPIRYRVISTQADGIVYADMDTLTGMQTMDYPNSIENLSCTLYVEKYSGTLDAMAIQRNKTIHQINEYTADFHADKWEDTYTLTTTLTNIYTPKGQPYEIKCDTIQFTQQKDMFLALHRLNRLQQK